MAIFQTRVLRAGAVSSERVEAPDRAAVAAVLGVAPQHVLEAREVSAAERAKPWRRNARFPLQLFSQELAVLLDAGIALLEALNTLREKEGQPGVRAALDSVIAQIEQGQPLSVALRQQPQAFDELICAIVAANERTGQLSTALAQHARYLAWVDALRDTPSTWRARAMSRWTVASVSYISLSGGATWSASSSLIPSWLGTALAMRSTSP